MSQFRYWLITACISILILGLAELSVRLFIHLEYGVPGKSYGIFESHPLLGGQLRANSYSLTREYNDHGFQTTENVDFRDGVARIVTYGGSTTFCYNLPMEQSWPLLLQERLRAVGDRAQVLNAGVTMWSSGHILVKAREQLSTLHPKLVIIYSGINEEHNRDFLKTEGRALADGNSVSGEVAFARNLTQSNWLYQNLLLYKIAHVIGGKITGWLDTATAHPAFPFAEEAPADLVDRTDPTTFENYLGNLRALKAVIENAGARMVFVIQARGRNDDKVNRLTAYSRRAASEMRRAGVIVLDPQRALMAGPGPLGSLFHDTGVHYSAAGAERFAAFLASALSPLLAN